MLSNGLHGPLADQFSSAGPSTSGTRSTMSLRQGQVTRSASTPSTRSTSASDIFGVRSPAKYEESGQEQGLERIVNMFHGAQYDPQLRAHAPATHATMVEDFKVTMDRSSGVSWSTSSSCRRALLRPGAGHGRQDQDHRDVWNQVGEMTACTASSTCHHEFYCGIRSNAESTCSTATPTRATSTSSSTPRSTASQASTRSRSTSGTRTG